MFALSFLLPGLCDDGFLHEGTYNNRIVSLRMYLLPGKSHFCYSTMCITPQYHLNQHHSPTVALPSNVQHELAIASRTGVGCNRHRSQGGGDYLLTQNSVATVCTAAAHYSNWWCIKLLLCWYSLSLIGSVQVTHILDHD